MSLLTPAFYSYISRIAAPTAESETTGGRGVPTWTLPDRARSDLTDNVATQHILIQL